MNTPFTELPIPKRTKEYIVIVREIDIPDHQTGNCMHPVGRTWLTSHPCGLFTSWQCAICNQWTCDLHEEKEKQFGIYAICESCGKLSKDDLKRVYAFQREMNEE